MRFLHVTSLYKINSTDDSYHSPSYHRRSSDDIFEHYSKMLEISSASARKHIKENNYERIVLTGEVSHIQEIFRKSLKDLYALWKENYPCNILYTGSDVLFVKDVSFTDKFNKFMMFNYTDPKSGFGFPHYFNADVKYYPATMDSSLWTIALEMEASWPSYNEWNYEQIIWNKMMWSQGEECNYFLNPKYAYQLVSLNIQTSNQFNNYNIDDAAILHCTGTRSLFEKLDFMQRYAAL